jgi:glycosyltransferase involved in cell wall biosynthesis
MKLLVIRGDLQSHSGYSAAARHYCQVLEGHVDRLVGVDIHFSADRPFEEFPYPLVTEKEARKLAAEADYALVLSFTTPDCYAVYPDAINVGLTFWETDLLPLQGAEIPPWVAQSNRMDVLWLPTTHTKEVFEKAGVTVPIRVIPWPIPIPKGSDYGLPEGEVYDLDRNPLFGKTLTSIAQITEDRFRVTRWLKNHACPRARTRLLNKLQSNPNAIAEPEKTAFLCVAQDVPRKGLALFLSEWLEFKRRPESKPYSLILKTYPINPQTSKFDFVIRFWKHVKALRRQLRVDAARVFLWTGDLTGNDFNRLLDNTFAQVAPSFGEGFCGPAALAIASAKPLVAPRFTAFGDYIAADYPYAFATRPARVSFVDDPLRVYDPASSWHLPLPFAVADALSRLAREDRAARDRACWRARAAFRNWCGQERVGDLLGKEIERLMLGKHQSAAA